MTKHMTHTEAVERYQLIVKMRSEGISCRQIGQHLSITRQRVDQIIRSGEPKQYIRTSNGGYVKKDLTICTNKLTGEKMTLKRHCELYGFEGRDYVREKVRVAYGHTCQGCGEFRHPSMLNKEMRQKSLDIHHLGGLCGKKSRKYDRVDDLTKLMPLCHKCHFNHQEHRSVRDGHHRLDKKTIKEIERLYGNGISMDNIAERVGTSYTSVRNTVQKLSTGR